MGALIELEEELEGVESLGQGHGQRQRQGQFQGVEAGAEIETWSESSAVQGQVSRVCGSGRGN